MVKRSDLDMQILVVYFEQRLGAAHPNAGRNIQQILYFKVQFSRKKFRMKMRKKSMLWTVVSGRTIILSTIHRVLYVFMLTL